MKIELVYTRVIGQSTPDAPPLSHYEPFTQRFVRTYRWHRTMMNVPLHVIFCGPDDGRKDDPLFADLNPVYHKYTGPGWDFGAFQEVAKELDCDMVFWMSTPVHFWRTGWLERIVEEAERYGDGLYGTMASYQFGPYIRTSCAAWSPQTMRDYPEPILNHEDCCKAEQTLGRMVKSKGKPVLMVTWDGCYEEKDWRTPPNIFRRGDQSNCMVWDRHNDIYACAEYATQQILEFHADGGHLPNPP